jgi:hypothetical protein
MPVISLYSNLSRNEGIEGFIKAELEGKKIWQFLNNSAQHERLAQFFHLLAKLYSHLHHSYFYQIAISQYGGVEAVICCKTVDMTARLLATSLQ